MCGRYLLTSAPEAIRKLFRYREQPNFPPRFNVAPTQPVPIVRLHDGERSFALVRWGLIPPFVKDPKDFALLINARAETANDKPSFRNAMKRRRCLFPADGFYEWLSVGGVKRPHVARPAAEGPIAFAGLWETWTGPNGEELETAAIVTTTANAEMGRIHHRAPAILPPQRFDDWLDCARVDESEAAAMLGPAPDGTMRVYEVSTAVGRVANDGPELIAPAPAAEAPPAPPPQHAAGKPSLRKAEPADERQGSLF